MTHRFALVILALIATYAALRPMRKATSKIAARPCSSRRARLQWCAKGSIKGDAGVDYKISARAGQTLAATMKPSNASTYFNILPARYGGRDVHRQYHRHDGDRRVA